MNKNKENFRKLSESWHWGSNLPNRMDIKLVLEYIDNDYD